MFKVVVAWISSSSLAFFLSFFHNMDIPNSIIHMYNTSESLSLLPICSLYSTCTLFVTFSSLFPLFLLHLFPSHFSVSASIDRWLTRGFISFFSPFRVLSGWSHPRSSRSRVLPESLGCACCARPVESPHLWMGGKGGACFPWKFAVTGGTCYPSRGGKFTDRVKNPRVRWFKSMGKGDSELLRGMK